MKTVAVSKLAMYYADKQTFIKTKGVVKETASVKHGNKVHEQLNVGVDYSRYIVLLILGVACYYFIFH